jgi:hypothetical protein
MAMGEKARSQVEKVRGGVCMGLAALGPAKVALNKRKS